jgi:AcrR family transcriptional regulator
MRKPAESRRRQEAGAGRRAVQATVAPEADEDPRERIVEAALHIFAAEGFETATLRAITERAGVNIAAVNYYFRSKDELLRHVLDRLIAPYIRARLDALEAVEVAAEPGAPALEAIVEALVRPMVELSRDAEGGRSLIRLILQVRALPRDETTQVFVERVDPVVHRFIAAFGRALPDLPKAEIFWRYNFALGSVMQVLTDSDPTAMRLKRLSAGLCDTDDQEGVIARLIRMLAAGFRAPATDA